MAKVRIQKVLSENGILSRRRAEAYIEEGRITVNGRPAQPGAAVDVRTDIIAIDGERVQFAKKQHKVYLMLNKPRGYVTTLSDELGRRCVAELVEDAPEKVYPVGRLDKNSEGLLLFTNDGDFANYIMHPSHHVSKTYRVTVRPDVSEDQLTALSAGVEIDGRMTAPAEVLVLAKEPGRVVLQMVIREGRNRQIRKMCEAVGLEVARLKRTGEGPLRLGMLQPGQWRELTPQEVGSLRNAVKEAPREKPENREKAPVSPNTKLTGAPRSKVSGIREQSRPGQKNGHKGAKTAGRREYGEKMRKKF